MILITGATGQVGREAVSALVAAGESVRVLVREPAKAPALEAVHVAQGSFEDDASLVLALEGVETLFLAGRDNPDVVAQHRRVLAHAREAGVGHIVKLSAIGASHDSPVQLMRDHKAVEDEVQFGAANWTFIRPHLYLQNLLRSAGVIREQGAFSAPMGDFQLPLVDTRDVGAAAAIVLQNPTAHAGKTYRLTGPKTYTYDDVADALSQIMGKSVSYNLVTQEDFRSNLIEVGLPEWRAYDLAYITSAYSPSDNEISPDVQTLLGRKPSSLADFLQDYQDVFVGVRK